MNRVHIRDFSRADHLRNVQVAFRAARRANADSFVGKADVERVAVGFGIDGNGGNAEFLARCKNTKGDFAAIGYEDFSEHFSWRTSAYFFPCGRMPKSGSPYSTG